MTAEQRERLEALPAHAKERAAHPGEMDAPARSDQEYAMEEFPNAVRVLDPWNLAMALVEMGFGERDLEAITGDLSPEALLVVIPWLDATYRVHNLLAEIAHGAGRISDIVKALKSYSFLD